MRNVSDIIERHLKNILLRSQEGNIEIQRNELADHFQCVPSQINYVISTRFTLEKGYVVESKRGGGGYIRISKLELPEQEAMQGHILQAIGREIDQGTAEGLIYQLTEAKLITARESNALKAAVSRDTINLMLPLRDEVRARLLKAMLVSLISRLGGD